MKKPKKPRNKAYKPREVQADAISWAIAGSFTLHAGTQTEIMRRPELAFDALRAGTAGRDEWNEICQAMNIGEALTEAHIGDNLRPDFDRAHTALHEIALRMLATGRSTCHAAELAALREGLDMYAIQLRLCTQAEFSRAIERVKNLLRGGAVDDVVRLYDRMNAA